MASTASSGPLGWIRLADRPRPEAAGVLAELHKLGLQTIMLTGDNARTAAAMARELGVGEERADLLPADKVTAIAELDARHGPDRHGRRRRQRRPRPGRRQGQHRAREAFPAGPLSNQPISSSWPTTSAGSPG